MLYLLIYLRPLDVIWEPIISTVLFNQKDYYMTMSALSLQHTQIMLTTLMHTTNQSQHVASQDCKDGCLVSLHISKQNAPF